MFSIIDPDAQDSTYDSLKKDEDILTKRKEKKEAK